MMNKGLIKKEIVEVYILGQKYILKGEEPPEYMKELADFVDSKIREILKSSPTTPPLKAAILAAISITDELFKLRWKEKSIIEYINKKADEMEFIFLEK